VTSDRGKSIPYVESNVLVLTTLVDIVPNVVVSTIFVMGS
jgi:hypothetical protein